jgi:uncharacterized protein YozE (UPF0346 family)
MLRRTINFRDFVLDYLDEDDEWGDLANAINNDRNFPRDIKSMQRAYIQRKMEPGALKVFDQIWRLYSTGHDPRQENR